MTVRAGFGESVAVAVEATEIFSCSNGDGDGELVTSRRWQRLQIMGGSF